jgi:hypothetical protein
MNGIHKALETYSAEKHYYLLNKDCTVVAEVWSIITNFDSQIVCECLNEDKKTTTQLCYEKSSELTRTITGKSPAV